MANKATRRKGIIITDDSLTPEQIEALRKQRATRYTDRYAKQNYRTIGFKCNIHKEVPLIAWLDAQPSLKGYLRDLITADMEKHPAELEEAIAMYEAAQENVEGVGDVEDLRYGDVKLVCKHCGEESVIRRNTYFNKPEKRICPVCGEIMEAENAPDAVLNNVDNK